MFRDFYLRADSILSSAVTILYFHRNTVIFLRLRKCNEKYKIFSPVELLLLLLLHIFEIEMEQAKKEYFNLEFSRW